MAPNFSSSLSDLSLSPNLLMTLLPLFAQVSGPGAAIGVAAMLAANLALGALCHRLFATGYRLRA